MTWQKWHGVCLSLVCLASIAATGCDSPSASNAPKKTDVDVKVGGGEGVKVDVDKKPAVPGEKADVDVKIGGGEGIKIDVDN